MIKLGNEMSFGENVEAQCLVSTTPDYRRKFEIKKLHDRRLSPYDDEAKFELHCFICESGNNWSLVWTWATEMRRECIDTKDMLIDAGRKIGEHWGSLPRLELEVEE